MADKKLSQEDLLASGDVLDNLRFDVTYTNPSDLTEDSKALEYGVIREKFEAFTNNAIQNTQITQDQIIIEILSSDIGATPNDTYNNIVTKLEGLKSFLAKNITCYIIFESGFVFDIGSNTLAIEGFNGGTLGIVPQATNFILKGSSNTISIQNNTSRIYISNMLFEGSAIFGYNSCLVIENCSFTNNILNTFPSVNVNNSIGSFWYCTFKIDIDSYKSPLFISENSNIIVSECTFDSTSTNPSLSNYGVDVSFNSNVETRNCNLLGFITQIGIKDQTSVLNIDSMIEKFDPTGSTTPLTATKKSDAIKELDLIKLNSADLPAQIAFELTGKTSDDIAQGSLNLYLTPSEKTNVSTPNGFQTLSQVNNLISSATVGLLNDRGNYNASTNLFPSTGGSGVSGAIKKGDIWTVSVAGTLGGVNVTAGDVVRALVDAPAQVSTKWSVTENNFGFVPENSVNKSIDPAEFTSSVKFPVWSAIIAFFTTSKIRELFGIQLNTVTTTNAVATPIKTFTIPTGIHQRIFIVVKGYSTTTPTNKVSYYTEFAVQNNGGVASSLGTFSVGVRYTSFSPAGSTNLTLTFSGANAIINVVGVAGQNINWEITTLNVI